MKPEDNDFVLLLDKPIGLSSRDASGKIKWHYELSKVGHLGTLDKEASGLLVILSGRCTKLERYLHALPKTYIGEIALGNKTVSDDIFTDIIESMDVPNFSQTDVDSLKENFSGSYLQIPPQVSAKKVEGKVAYKEVRQGREIELTAKEVTCTINHLEKVDDETISYSVTCSSGFYVRSFARDLGIRLGTFGAAKSIRRTQVGDYKVEEGIEIADGKVIESDKRSSFYNLNQISHDIPLPEIVLEDGEIASKIKHGNKQSLMDLLSSEKEYRAKVYYKGDLLSVVSKDNNDVIFEVNF